MTLLIAMYGAVISTLALLWNVLRARSRFRVEMIFAAYSAPQVREESLGAVVIIKNYSEKPVFVRSVSLLAKCREFTFLDRIRHLRRFQRWPGRISYLHLMWAEDIPTGLPREILPGDSHTIFIPDSEIRKICLNNKTYGLRASVQDALGRNRRSEHFEYYLEGSEFRAELDKAMEEKN